MTCRKVSLSLKEVSVYFKCSLYNVFALWFASMPDLIFVGNLYAKVCMICISNFSMLASTG